MSLGGSQYLIHIPSRTNYTFSINSPILQIFEIIYIAKEYHSSWLLFRLYFYSILYYTCTDPRILLESLSMPDETRQPFQILVTNNDISLFGQMWQPEKEFAEIND